MSTRQLRRVRRLKELESADAGSGDSGEETTIQRRTTNAFTLLSENELSEDAASEGGLDGLVSEEPDLPVKNSCSYRDSNSCRISNIRDDAWSILEAEDDRVPLLPQNGRGSLWYQDIKLDRLEESREIRERIGSTTGQLRRPSNRLIAPRKSWPKIPESALGFKVTGAGKTGEYRVECSEEYLDKYYALQAIVSSADVAALTLFHKQHPHVIEGYLLMSDIMRQHSVADAAVLVELAIYLFEKALPIGFSWANSTLRLPYCEQPDNRIVHLALFRHCQYLVRRASWKAALEVCKIMFLMSPEEDPLLVILFVDFILLQSNDVRTHDKLCSEIGSNPKYPFLRYTNCLLHSATDSLNNLEAYQVHTKTNYTENYTHAVFKLYFARAAGQWKTIRLSPSNLIEHNVCDLSFDDTLAVYRHGLLCDQQSIHLSYPSVSADTTSLDPFPPLTDGVDYDRSNRGSSFLSYLFQRLL